MDQMYRSRVSGNEESYIVYLPPCYETDNRRYPTLYLIHGAYQDNAHWESLGTFEAMDEGLRSGKYSPAIIVLPSGDDQLYADTSGGTASYEEQIVKDLVPIMDRLFRTDPRPEMRAIGGISRGGVWSLEIGFLHPELFGIVGGHSACLNLNKAPPAYDPLKMTDKLTLKAQRIWLDASDRDGCLQGVNDLHTALEQSDVAHQYEIWPGVHDDAYWAEHLDEYLTFYTQTWPKL
jgi:enterochelin esterase-like enzyme